MCVQGEKRNLEERVIEENEKNMDAPPVVIVAVVVWDLVASECFFKIRINDIDI